MSQSKVVVSAKKNVVFIFPIVLPSADLVKYLDDKYQFFPSCWDKYEGGTGGVCHSYVQYLQYLSKRATNIKWFKLVIHLDIFNT